MGLRKATDAEVLKHFMYDDALKNMQGDAVASVLNQLRDQMGLVMDTSEVSPIQKKCGTCGSTDIKYIRGGYQDPGSYLCLNCRSSLDEAYSEKGWRKPLLDHMVWDMLEIAALHDPRARAFLRNHRKPAGGTCWHCQTPTPQADGGHATCKACEIKYNRIEMEKRYGA